MAVVVAAIGAALYPTVVVPLQIAYGGRERPQRPDAPLQAGFSKKGVWREIESSSKKGEQ